MDRKREQLVQRLRRIEGQIRGIQKMFEEERYCVDILHQINAARGALDQVGLALLEQHTRGCVATAIRSDQGEQAIDELVELITKFSR